MTDSTLTSGRHYRRMQHHGNFLGSAALGEPWSQEFVLYWSTDLTAEEFVGKCNFFLHAPGNLKQIEVIADHERLRSDDPQLQQKLRGRRLVRFNASSWSVTWLAGKPGQHSEVQAVMTQVPKGMRTMVTGSISGFDEASVDALLADLQPAA